MCGAACLRPAAAELWAQRPRPRVRGDGGTWLSAEGAGGAPGGGRMLWAETAPVRWVKAPPVPAQTQCEARAPGPRAAAWSERAPGASVSSGRPPGRVTSDDDRTRTSVRRFLLGPDSPSFNEGFSSVGPSVSVGFALVLLATLWRHRSSARYPEGDAGPQSLSLCQEVLGTPGFCHPT